MESLSRVLRGLWKGYFERLMNNVAEVEAVVTGMGIKTGRGRIPMQIEIGRLEVERKEGKKEKGNRESRRKKK